MSVTWLSSYPKSGNTWLRFMVANMVSGPLDTTEHLQSIVPDMHDPLTPDHMRRWLALPHQVMKTHLVYQEADPFRGRIGRIVSLVRNPLDVLASSLNFSLLTKLGPVADSADAPDQPARFRREYVDSFLESGGDPDWIAVGFGSWPQHVRSWDRAAERYPLLRLRYEDVLDDPLAAAHTLRAFLELECSDAAIEEAVEAASFSRMRDIERKEVREGRPGFFRKWHERSDPRGGVWFSNRGRSGGGKALLTEEEIARATEVFGPVMEDLGYSIRPDQPARSPDNNV